MEDGIGRAWDKLWLENFQEKHHLEDPNIDSWTILKWTSSKQDGRVWAGFIWL
jgi:hypothetical protein